MLKGDVHVVTLRGDGTHELAGRRYGVVVQSDAIGIGSTVVLAPTSTSAIRANFRPEIGLLGKRTAVVTDHLRVMDRRKVGRRVGRLTADEMHDVNDALKLLLGLI